MATPRTPPCSVTGQSHPESEGERVLCSKSLVDLEGAAVDCTSCLRNSLKRRPDWHSILLPILEEHTHLDLKGHHRKAVSNYCISSKSRFCCLFVCLFFSDMPSFISGPDVVQLFTKKTKKSSCLTQYTQWQGRYRIITIKATQLSNIFDDIKYTLHEKLHEVHSYSLSSNLRLNNMVMVLSASWHHQ